LDEAGEVGAAHRLRLRALRGKLVYVGPDPDAKDKLAAMAPLASYVTVAAPSFHAYLGARIDTPSYHLW